MKLTRKQLYDLVWTEPLTAISKRLEISGAELGKRCAAANIPLPPNGYWSKLIYGKNIDKALLSGDENEEVDLAPYLTPQQIIEKEISKGDQSVFKVPEILYAKDPLIIDTKEKHREDMIPWSQRKNPYKSKIKESLNVSVGEKTIDRALCIFSTVINVLRLRGHSIKIHKKNEYNSVTYAVINGEEIKIDLTERRRMKSDATSTRDTEYSGELHFNIYGEWRDTTTYKDTTHTRLEDKIIEIIANLEFRSKKIKEDRVAEEEHIRKEKEAKEREEREKFEANRQAELKEFRMMFNMAERLRKANMLRQYIADYEEYLKTSDVMDDEVTQKLEWARKKADWLDPFIDVEDEYLNEDDKDQRIEPVKTESTVRRSSTTETETYSFWTRPYRWFNKKR
ncbi:hypothetical protein [Prevotella sp. 10(H)]|uniref:hypothetical protein n=1 Tax=Prevotella sp. 10(H) TaxID=1158294 RepID=UPI0004A6F467|nr:hypothetical protein [Prevotella sp. 10(H)]